jgi:GT2 family glycosyltransferase
MRAAAQEDDGARIAFGFVCVNYNNSPFTRIAVESLSGGCGRPIPIVVVDNHSSDDDISNLRRIASDFSNVTLLLHESNVGYFGGLNLGIQRIRAKMPELTHIVVGNNDLLFPPEFERSLARNRLSIAEYAVVSPDIVTLDGVHQNPHVIEKISRIREFVYDLYYANYYLARVISRIARATRAFTDRRDEERWGVGGPIYQGHGACYILGPRFFELFDELCAPSFLMGEELFLSWQLSRKGLRVYYEPGIRVVHQCHASVGRLSSKRIWEISRDAHRIYRKYVRNTGSAD